MDLAVTPGSLQDDIFQIYRALQPNAEREQLHFEELRGGFVNSIWRVTRAASKSETNPEIGRSLVFRSFGTCEFFSFFILFGEWFRIERFGFLFTQETV